MFDLPPLLKAALQLRAETDISRLFLPDVNTPNQPPLWQVLCNAGNPPCPVEEMLAAEILAFCDWLLPAENSPDVPHRDDPIAWKVWQERQRLRSILIEEASKAQKQEV